MTRANHRYINGLLPEIDEQLRQIAEQQGRTPNALKREVLTNWVLEHTKRARTIERLDEPSEDEMARTCLRYVDHLDKWEQEFIDDNTHNGRWLGETEKQSIRLLKAYRKVCRLQTT